MVWIGISCVSEKHNDVDYKPFRDALLFVIAQMGYSSFLGYRTKVLFHSTKNAIKIKQELFDRSCILQGFQLAISDTLT